MLNNGSSNDEDKLDELQNGITKFRKLFTKGMTNDVEELIVNDINMITKLLE